jgi:CRP-like cAMP-binding protein
MQTETFAKGDFLVEAGQLSSRTYFVLIGCIREYIVNDGEEKTTRFFTEEQWAILLSNFSPADRATHNWVCMENTTGVVGDEQSAQKKNS